MQNRKRLLQKITIIIFIGIYFFNMLGTIVYALEGEINGVPFTYDPRDHSLEIKADGMESVKYKMKDNGELSVVDDDMGTALVYSSLYGVAISYPEKDIQQLTGYSAEHENSGTAGTSTTGTSTTGTNTTGTNRTGTSTAGTSTTGTNRTGTSTTGTTVAEDAIKWTNTGTNDYGKYSIDFEYDTKEDKINAIVHLHDRGLNEDLEFELKQNESGEYQPVSGSPTLARELFLLGENNYTKNKLQEKMQSLGVQPSQEKDFYDVDYSYYGNLYKIRYEENSDGTYSIAGIYYEENGVTKKVTDQSVYEQIEGSFKTSVAGASEPLSQEQVEKMKQESADNPYTDQAEQEGKDLFDWLGGTLFRPFLDLIVTLGDVIINALQATLMEPEKVNDSSVYEIGKYLLSADENTKPPEYNGKTGSSETIEVDASKFHYGWLNFRKTFNYIDAKYSPEEIFSNTSEDLKIPAFNINFFSGEVEGDQLNLRKAISDWYKALRYLAIAGLLCVLVYMGIRILISATAADKAKYKQLLKDWLVALILLFTMHYIMAFTVTITEAIVNGINPDSGSSVTIHVKSNRVDETFQTNLIGAARFQTQYSDYGRRMPYVVMYIALVVYTVIFTVYYFRRALMMAFLTMTAPLVALTYPIDKITDGKAQAFNAWVKDYVYNALLQPFHLILYTIFVSNALNFAQSNAFYMIASLWFIMTAEKILRGFFGFNKASSGTMEALHTVGLASMLNTIAKGGPRLRGAANDEGKQGKEDNSIRFSGGVDAAQLAEGIGAGASSGGSLRTGSGASSGAGFGAGSETSSGAGVGTSFGAGSGAGVGTSFGASSGTRTRTDSRASSGSRGGSNDGLRRRLGRVVRHRTNGLSRKIYKNGKKGIRGAARFGVRTAFTAGAGALAGAVALASGGDLGAAFAAASAGAGIGGRVGNWVGDKGEGIINRVNEDLDVADATGERRRTREANKKMYDSDEYYNYVRDSMIKANNGEIPTTGQVEARLEEYRPFIERGFNIQEAEKAAKVADTLGTDYNQAALMLAAGKEREISRSVLNKESDRKQYMANLQAELEEQGYDSDQARMIADKEFSYMERYYGVEDHQERQRKEKARQKEEEEATRQRQQDEAKAQEQRKAEKAAKKAEKEERKAREKEAEMKRQAELNAQAYMKMQQRENKRMKDAEKKARHEKNAAGRRGRKIVTGDQQGSGMKPKDNPQNGNKK